MKYQELISKVIDDFYTNKKEFPQDLMYPIIILDGENRVNDLFMVCDVLRNTENGELMKVSDPFEFYFLDKNTNSGRFSNEESSCDTDLNIEFNEEFNISIGDFTSLYTEVRDFAFESEITDEQKIALKKLVFIYDKLFDEKVGKIYRKYGSSFFKWAYSRF